MPRISSVLTRPSGSEKMPVEVNASNISESLMLSKLQSFGIYVTRSKLEKMFDRTRSMRPFAEFMYRKFSASREPVEPDTIKDCLIELSRRWFSAKLSFDRLSDNMDALRFVSIEKKKGLDSWQSVWKDALELQHIYNFCTAREFDDHFLGKLSLHIWFNIFDNQLRQAGNGNAKLHTKFNRLRISLNQEAISRFSPRDTSPTDDWTNNRRNNIACAYFELGERENVDLFYKQWLAAMPGWLDGWEAWSGLYAGAWPPRFDKAEQILQEGLATEETSKECLLMRLIALYRKQGRDEEADTLDSRLEQMWEERIEREVRENRWDSYDDEEREHGPRLREFWNDEALESAMAELILTPK